MSMRLAQRIRLSGQPTTLVLRGQQPRLAVPRGWRFNSSTGEAPATYHPTIQWLHWGVAGGVIGALGLTWVAKNEKPEVRSQLFRYHEQLGLLALALAAPRLAVRFVSKSPAAMPGPMIEHLAAHAAHFGLYGLMFGVPMTGIAMMWMSGAPVPVIGPLEIPGKKGATDADQAFAKWSGDIHRLMGSVFEALIAAHVAAAGYHIVMDHNPTPRIVPSQLMHIVNHIDVAARTRPGPLTAGLGMAALGALWIGSVAKELLGSVLGGDVAVAAAAPAGSDGKWRMITPEEVEQHNKEEDLWIIIDGSVYDLTKYHKQHPAPAGPGVIIKNAGTDSSAPFRAAKHSPKAVELRDKFKIGELERNLKTELARIMNCDDMQEKAKNLLTEGALAYYDAGAEDRTSMSEALECWDRDWRLRPRNFIDVSTVDTGTTVLGHRLEVPIMAAPTALLKMGHEDGEAAVARGCHMTGVGNCLSTTASLSMEDVALASPDCYRWFQLYVYKDHEMTKRLIQRADQAGYAAIVMTVDLPVLGNRTSLKRMGFSVPKEFKMANVVSEQEKSADLKKQAEAAQPKQEEKKEEAGVSLKDPGDRAAYVNKLYDQSLTLELIPWIAEITDKPVVIKGLLRGDSAALCSVFKNVEGVVVSNHGGRQLDNCLAPLTALPDVVNAVNQVNIERVKKGWKPVEVYVDGGIKRGRDIFKALALGAKAVMVGRPMIYGMAVGGELGVARTVEMLRDELKICMQLGGTQTVDQIDRTFIVRHGKENDEALTLEAGSVEAKAAPLVPADILKISAKQDAAKAAAQIVTGK